MKKHFVPVLLVLVAAFMTSCVAKKKFVESENQRTTCEATAASLKQELETCGEEKVSLNNSIATLNKEVKTLKDAKKQLEEQNASLQKSFDELSSSSLSQKQKMDAAMKKKIEEIEKREQAILQLKAAMDAKDQALRDVFSKLEKAMNQYNKDELSIEIKNGKIYVAISDKLLFKSGSAKLDARGQEALSSLSSVMVKEPELDIIVEGHTDNVPIKTERYADNWDLSVIRATSVTRLLTQEYGLAATQVTPSGRAEFFPKGSNETAEGKAMNRRTEIIIAPKLDEIYNMIKK